MADETTRPKRTRKKTTTKGRRKSATTKKETAKTGFSVRKEVRGLLLLAFALVGVLGYFGIDMGMVGDAIAGFFKYSFGWGGIVVAIFCLYVSARILYNDTLPSISRRRIGGVLFFVFFLTLISLIFVDFGKELEPSTFVDAGGLAGGLLAFGLHTVFGNVGAILVDFILLIAAGIMVSNKSLRQGIHITKDKAQPHIEAAKEAAIDKAYEVKDRLEEWNEERKERKIYNQAREEASYTEASKKVEKEKFFNGTISSYEDSPYGRAAAAAMATVAGTAVASQSVEAHEPLAQDTDDYHVDEGTDAPGMEAAETGLDSQASHGYSHETIQNQDDLVDHDFYGGQDDNDFYDDTDYDSHFDDYGSGAYGSTEEAYGSSEDDYTSLSGQDETDNDYDFHRPSTPAESDQPFVQNRFSQAGADALAGASGRIVEDRHVEPSHDDLHDHIHGNAEKAPEVEVIPPTSEGSNLHLEPSHVVEAETETETSSPTKGSGILASGLQAAGQVAAAGTSAAAGLAAAGTSVAGGLAATGTTAVGGAVTAGIIEARRAAAMKTALMTSGNDLVAAGVSAAGNAAAAAIAATTTLASRDALAGTITPKSVPTMESTDADTAAVSVSKDQEVVRRIERPYHFPSLEILSKGPEQPASRNEEVAHNAAVLEETLKSFGLTAKVVNATQGPAVTRYEIQPAPGTRVSKIVNLTDDLKMALAATDIRMEAPIPGKSAVGIEVPNRSVSPVHLRDVLDCEDFKKATGGIPVGLGKDIAGKPIITDLAKMPHLLVAGSTGSGKSVCINTIISSILFNRKPDEVKLILIDPKMVELSVYNNIPHLMSPVVTDMKKASAVLRWAVREMESRYLTFSTLGVRKLEEYNKRYPDKAMPLILIVIDEMADLMMTAPADIEESIVRLAQKARAAGIHMILATQRPSVNVITGLIKANVPSRISFAVATQIDSRTILDMAGAEKLLGKGDMLFNPIGANKPIRIQGAFISDDEVEELVNFVKAQGAPTYNDEVTKEEPADEAKEEDSPEQMQDELLERAVDLIMETGQASVSMLQRRFRIGYTRAARLVDMMEDLKIVGPSNGSKARDILMTPAQVKEKYFNQGGSSDGAQ